MVARRLSPDERAVWTRVAASVRALRGAGVANVAEAPPPTGGGERAGLVTANILPRFPNEALPKPRVGTGGNTAASKRAAANTLDGSWDRKLATGMVGPERTIDLHGCTLDQAHRRLDHALDTAIADGVRVLLLVTGRAPHRDASRIDLPLRGIIRASIGDWIAASRHIRRIAAIRPAHPRHGGAGALYVILRRVKS